MEDCHIRANRLGHDYVFTRVKRVFLHQQIGAIHEDVAVQQSANGKKRESHRSSLDHAIQHPSRAVLHLDETRAQRLLKIRSLTIDTQRTGAGFVLGNLSCTNKQIGVQSPASQSDKPKLLESSANDLTQKG